MINLTWQIFVLMFDIHSFLSQNFRIMSQLLKINLPFLNISCRLNGRWDPKWQRILLCVRVAFTMKSAQLCLSSVPFTHYSPTHRDMLGWFNSVCCLKLLLTEASYTGVPRICLHTLNAFNTFTFTFLLFLNSLCSLSHQCHTWNSFSAHLIQNL